jgi:integrase
VREIALGYGRYLFWLQELGKLDDGLSPAARVTRDLVRSYVEELKRTNRGYTPYNRIQELGNAMRALAPEEDWSWLLRAAGRLRINTIPADDKRARLRPVTDLVAQGFRMMDEADLDQRSSKLGRAAHFRDGLVIAFLGSHPLRLRNFASLRLGQHVISEGEQFLLKLVAAETKGRRPYEAEIAPPLAKAIGRYLNCYRPVLLQAKGRWHSAASNALWISRDGSPCREQTFANIIRKHTVGSDGRPLSPRLFRSCAATTVAITAPGSIDIIPAILGHASPVIGERYYNLATSLEASRAHNATLEQLLKDLARKSP